MPNTTTFEIDTAKTMGENLADFYEATKSGKTILFNTACGFDAFTYETALKWDDSDYKAFESECNEIYRTVTVPEADVDLDSLPQITGTFFATRVPLHLKRFAKLIEIKAPKLLVNFEWNNFVLVYAINRFGTCLEEIDHTSTY